MLLDVKIDITDSWDSYFFYNKQSQLGSNGRKTSNTLITAHLSKSAFNGLS